MIHPLKYANLEICRELVAIPPTVLITEDDFARAISGFAAIDDDLERVLTEISVTSGAALERHLGAIESIVTDLRWKPDDAVVRRLDAALPAWRSVPLAVRSAAPGEDRRTRSSAGLYRSVLDVRGPVGVAAALLDVWRSFFAWGAVLERLAAGTLCDGRRMCAMIQPMVEADAAGVVFTCDPITGAPEMVLEYVEGRGDGLVSGEASGRRLRAYQTEAPGTALAPDAVEQIFDAAARLRDAMAGEELDIEWAFNRHGLHILQIRPITTLGAAFDAAQGPVFRALDLFLASDADVASLGPTPEFVRYFRQKRSPLRRLAARLGLPVPGAVALAVNRSGLARTAAEGLPVCLRSDRVVMDVSERARQIIVPRASLGKSLGAALPAGDETRVVALRDFVGGQLGMITRSIPDGVIVEWSADGLLALNRGTADSAVARLTPSQPPPNWMAEAEADLVQRAQAQADATFGRVQLEWVRDGALLLLLDYSPVAAGSDEGLGRDSVLSAGFATAPLLRVEASRSLLALSEGPSISIGSVPDGHRLGGFASDLLTRLAACPVPPIVVCPRPYAALAVLLPHVAGFVFEHGSLLSHLAILIREAGKPAICLPEGFGLLRDGVRTTLDVPSDPARAPRCVFAEAVA